MAFCQGFHLHSHGIVCLRQPNVVLHVSSEACRVDETWRFWETFDIGSHFFMLHVNNRVQLSYIHGPQMVVKACHNMQEHCTQQQICLTKV